MHFSPGRHHHDNELTQSSFEKMSREEILSSFNFIIVGGTETSATILTGIFNTLCMPEHRAILSRLTAEIRQQYPTEADITLERVNKAELPYLEAVLNEGLRVFNPIPSGLPRMVPEGGDEYAGVWLPGGVGLLSFTLSQRSCNANTPQRRPASASAPSPSTARAATSTTPTHSCRSAGSLTVRPSTLMTA